MTESDREFTIGENDENNVFPWIVTSYIDSDTYQKPWMIEAYSTESRALEVGNFRHKEGYTVVVSKTIAYTTRL